jgi:uncharacterized membrane protein HdeD (DUF308 family)
MSNAGVQYPLAASRIIGVLVGINLMFSGWSFIMLAIGARRRASNP